MKHRKKHSPDRAILLVSVKSNLLGVVLNAVDAGAPDYYYSYRYYPYSYGYGPQEALELGHQDEEPDAHIYAFGGYR